MTKAELIADIARKTGINKGDTSTVVEAFLKLVKTHMSKGEEIVIKGFGRFGFTKHAKRVGQSSPGQKKDSRFQKTVEIPERIYPKLFLCKAFNQKVNESKAVWDAFEKRKKKKK